MAAEQLLDAGARRVTRVAIQRALAGEPTALRLVMERILSPRRDRIVRLRLPTMRSVADHPIALAAVLAAVADGEIAPAEGQAVAAVLAEHRRAIETVDLEARISDLEQRAGQ